MEYAILLAKAGREEDAKAMYYYGLRNLNPGQTRSVEPSPFLMVFDPEPEGAVWEYTRERLEAAALVVQAMCGGTMVLATRKQILPEELAIKANRLAPEWYYPLLFKAARSWLANWAPALLGEAESLAKPGLESQLVARYRQELAEHKAYIEAEEMFGAKDTRPMREGNDRRARMRCLKPNEQVLKRLSVQFPGK
ncbi:MAG: hypothetical protein HZC36_07480 [Armatimonadetes bacterium]|nr:hypothetical protein [Armatimonadota bacterium]